MLDVKIAHGCDWKIFSIAGSGMVKEAQSRSVRGQKYICNLRLRIDGCDVKMPMAIIWQTTPRNGHLVVRRASNPAEGGASAIFRIVEEHEIRRRVVAVGKKCLDLRFRCKNSTLTWQLGPSSFAAV